MEEPADSDNEDRNVKQLLIENRNMEREMTLKKNRKNSKNRIHQTLRNL